MTITFQYDEPDSEQSRTIAMLPFKPYDAITQAKGGVHDGLLGDKHSTSCKT
jgi:hypothetical protein